MHTDDQELIDLFKRLGIGIVVLGIFSFFFILFLSNKFSPRSPKIIESVNNGETMYVLIDKKKCTTCKRIKEILKEYDIDYYEINVDKDAHYEDFLKAISVTENEVVIPTLMYIKEGTLDSTIVKVEDEEILKAFIENTK